ncbi:MAG: Ca-activated chloride channel [Acidobacteriota bacterium]|jgi:Ca-activated chloride channel family protein|nr:Ca-activated chloride channel [Acidobacteriota bacterium]
MRSSRNLVPIQSSILTIIFVLSAMLFLMVAAMSCSKSENMSTRVSPAETDTLNAYAPKSMPPPGMDQLTGSMNTEEYGRIAENGFLRVTDNPLSTFSIDVDRASYSNVRRFLDSGQMPVRDAVRIEEMVNYFTYDYPQPKGSDPFSVTTEIAACPWNAKNRLLLVGLQGKKIQTDELPPSNLVFLIDVSGSMNEENKLPLLKKSLSMLVNELRAKDRVAIVVYAGNAGLALPSTPGSDKARILAAIDELEAGGSTAGGEGILLAYKTAKENLIEDGNNRVILATDGDFNVGVSSDGELEQLIEKKRTEGIALTVLGFGNGNIKDSKMELLADKGDGNYAYIDNLLEARKTLVTEMGGTLLTIAKDVKLQIEFNPSKVLAYRLIGYENRLLNKEDFHNDAKDAGDMGAGHSVTALYEIVPPDGDLKLANVDALKYQTTGISDEAKKSPELLTLKLRYKAPDGGASKLLTQPVLDSATTFDAASDNLRFAAAVAEFGMLLRDSKYKGDASYDAVRQLALKSAGRDEEGYRRDFVKLVDQASRLAATEKVASR